MSIIFYNPFEDGFCLNISLQIDFDIKYYKYFDFKFAFIFFRIDYYKEW